MELIIYIIVIIIGAILNYYTREYINKHLR